MIHLNLFELWKMTTSISLLRKTKRPHIFILSSSGSGGQRPGPPTPVKTSQKKDGCCTGQQVSRVIGSPRTNFWIPYCFFFCFCFYKNSISSLQATGRELLIHLIDHLLSNYHTNGTIKSLLDTTRIHIMVSMNPDGFENATQYIRRYNNRRCVGTYGRYLVCPY